MNVALIIAGGNGSRMKQEIPKQFLTVMNKPIIIYTLEKFQNHPGIDKIQVVCLKGWEEILKAYAKQYNITKLMDVVPGGCTGQESIANGVNSLKSICSKDDLVIIHDAVRPVINDEIISDCLVKASEHGNAVSSIPIVETIIKTSDKISGKESIPRDSIMRVQTPQCYKYDKLVWAYDEAKKRNITNTTYVNTLFVELGETLYFSSGSEKNIKITTIDDLEVFKAFLQNNNDDGLKR